MILIGNKTEKRLNRRDRRKFQRRIQRKLILGAIKGLTEVGKGTENFQETSG